MIEINKKYLITSDTWFLAPDGVEYRAVFGTVKQICKDSDILGITTNRHSTDWYVQIGNMTIAGCQIYHAIQTDYVRTLPVSMEEGKDCKYTRIYVAE